MVFVEFERELREEEDEILVCIYAITLHGLPSPNSSIAAVR